jgi:hypothetical protein
LAELPEGTKNKPTLLELESDSGSSSVEFVAYKIVHPRLWRLPTPQRPKNSFITKQKNNRTSKTFSI